MPKDSLWDLESDLVKSLSLSLVGGHHERKSGIVLLPSCVRLHSEKLMHQNDALWSEGAFWCVLTWGEVHQKRISMHITHLQTVSGRTKGVCLTKMHQQPPQKGGFSGNASNFDASTSVFHLMASERGPLASPQGSLVSVDASTWECASSPRHVFSFTVSPTQACCPCVCQGLWWIHWKYMHSKQVTCIVGEVHQVGGWLGNSGTPCISRHNCKFNE